MKNIWVFPLIIWLKRLNRKGSCHTRPAETGAGICSQEHPRRVHGCSFICSRFPALPLIITCSGNNGVTFYELFCLCKGLHWGFFNKGTTFCALSNFFCLAQSWFGDEVANQPNCSVGQNCSINPSTGNPQTSLLLKIGKVNSLFKSHAGSFCKQSMLELLELYLSSFFSHTKIARNLPQKYCVIDGFQAVIVMLALDLPEKLTK